MSLLELFTEHNGRGCGKWNHYLDVYERYLKQYVGKEVLLFEIGVCRGGSLQIWKKFLGDKCKIVGFDIDPYAVYSEEQITVELGNGCDYEFLQKMVEKYGNPDIVIDDGSHVQQEIMQSFSFLYPNMKENGTYVIEDTHTAYRPEFGGGITSPFNVHTIFSRFTHDVNNQFIIEPFTPTVPDLKSISFYNSMIIFEKGDGKDVTPLFTGDEKDKNAQLQKEHVTSQIGVDNPQPTKQELSVPEVSVREEPKQKESSLNTSDIYMTPEKIRELRNVTYTPQSPIDKDPPKGLSENEESLFKWNI